VVRTFFAASLLFLIAVPALAQDDYPRIQMGFGYANLTLPVTTQNPLTLAITSTNQHNSGFTSSMNFNFTRNIGLDYYLGYYSLGNNSQLFTNIFGGKLQYPTDKLTPYVVAGFGLGSGISGYYSTGSSAAYRMGGGVDYKLGDAFYWRVEVSKLGIHGGLDANGNTTWIGNMNIATGIVLTLMQ
jgi:hypothetical protein